MQSGEFYIEFGRFWWICLTDAWILAFSQKSKNKFYCCAHYANFCLVILLHLKIWPLKGDAALDLLRFDPVAVSVSTVDTVETVWLQRFCQKFARAESVTRRALATVTFVTPKLFAQQFRSTRQCSQSQTSNTSVASLSSWTDTLVAANWAICNCNKSWKMF